MKARQVATQVYILYKEFVDISYENASFGIQEDSIWLQLIYFLTTIAFWSMK